MTVVFMRVEVKANWNFHVMKHMIYSPALLPCLNGLQ